MGRFSIALVPFWRLDAKGGEVVLFRLLLGICMGGHEHSNFLFVSYMLMPMYLTFLHVCRCKLCLCV